MEIRLTKQLLSENEQFFEKRPWDIQDRYNHRSYTDIDLRKYTEEEVDKLLDLVKVSKSKGARGIQKDIEAFLHIFRDKGEVKLVRARTVRHAYALLVEYFLRHSKRKWVYKSYAEESTTLAYYISEIEYHEARKEGGWYNPEFLSMELVYERFGELEKFNTHLQINNCLGRNPREILQSIGLLYDRPSLREDYEKYLEMWVENHDKIGKQMLAVGSGDTGGIDGNQDDDDDDYSWRRSNKSVDFNKSGEPARVVIDLFKEAESRNKKSKRDQSPDPWFWKNQKAMKESSEFTGEAKWDEDDALTEDLTVEIPIHPYVVCFDLQRHLRLKVHVGNLSAYEYDKTIRDKLVLPEVNAKLIDVLLMQSDTHFKDIVRGKTGGMIVICQGPPGTGKTLTAEIYAESMERPLYNVQCSQLGTDPDSLEKNLMKILARGKRWNAVTLLDEADVYVHERGNDLTQNAIVGVFLRVLEYHAGVLFLTTNRGDLVDDAILSRCTARIPYGVPDVTQQHRIWRVMADANGITLGKKAIHEIVDAHPKLSGRDIKNLLKLASLVAKDRGVNIDAELIGEMKIFKPTFTSIEEKD